MTDQSKPPCKCGPQQACELCYVDDKPASCVLEPCPFCGLSDKVTLQTLSQPDSFYVACSRCKTCQHADFTEADAIRVWNTRGDSPEKLERLAEYLRGWNCALLHIKSNIDDLLEAGKENEITIR
jgi:Lar family restriction alleviation protein